MPPLVPGSGLPPNIGQPVPGGPGTQPSSTYGGWGGYGGQPWPSYFLPGFDYGDPLAPYGGSPNSELSDYLQKQNWQIAYDYWSQGAGLSPTGQFAQFVRSQEPLIQRAFNTAMISNNNLTPQTFLGQYLGSPTGGSGGLYDTFRSLPYQQRGEDPSQWGQGRVQWVRRNN